MPDPSLPVPAGPPTPGDHEAEAVTAAAATLSEHMESGEMRPRILAALMLKAARPHLAAAGQPDMYEQVYWDIQRVLDEALGTEEKDGAGAGMEADVRLLVAQRDEARTELENLRRALVEAGKEMDRRYEMGVAAERERIAKLAEREGAKIDAGHGTTGIKGVRREVTLREFADLLRQGGEGGTG